MLRCLQRTKDELLTPRHTREMIKRHYKNHQTLHHHQPRSTRASLRIRPRVSSPSGYYQSAMPICNTEAFDTACNPNSGRGSRETLHIRRLQQLRAVSGGTIALSNAPNIPSVASHICAKPSRSYDFAFLLQRAAADAPGEGHTCVVRAKSVPARLGSTHASCTVACVL